MIYLCYYFASKSEVPVNMGILSSIFSSSIVYTSIYFYFYFGQALSSRSILGILAIMASICLISLSNEVGSEVKHSPDDD
mmetsp:Transcript_2556/g.4289  ORF Transcript_2556/g.4289 Transcript_2556/m.4289 type:complete len:80 (-) Transcript_2556:681-920(-)